MKKRVMLVDDDSNLSAIIRMNLEFTGLYEVRTVNNPEYAVGAAERFHPDVILMDVMMEEMDGGSTAFLINSHPRLKHIPVIFMSAAVKPEEIIACGGLIGGLPFLSKPMNFHKIVDAIEQSTNAPVVCSGEPGALARN